MPDRLIELGRVVSAYGIKGWVKVQPHSARAEVLFSARQWWLARLSRVLTASTESTPPASDAAQAVTVLAARPQGDTVVAQLQGVADRTQAEALRGTCICVPRSAFPPAQEGEYYWVDLVGCLVYGEQDGQPTLLGRVADMTDNGVHAILKVEKLVEKRVENLAPSPGSGDLVPVLDAKGRPVESLVPFVDAHLRTVDLATRRIDTDWPADF